MNARKWSEPFNARTLKVKISYWYYPQGFVLWLDFFDRPSRGGGAHGSPYVEMVPSALLNESPDEANGSGCARTELVPSPDDNVSVEAAKGDFDTNPPKVF